MKHKHSERGFIALMSAVVISATLLLLAAGIGLSGIYDRFDQLDSELKERSNALAEACVDVALLQLSSNPNFNSPTMVALPPHQCFMGNFSANGGLVTFETQASSSNYFTNLKVTYSTNHAVSSWQEIPTF